MTEALAYLRDIDLAGNARRLWDLIENIDPCFGGLVMIVMVCLGHKMAIGHRTLYTMGVRLGVLAFLLHAGWAIVRNGGWESLSWAPLISRSGLVGGSVLAATWITLPVAIFVFRYFRVALITFLLYCGYGVATAEALEQDILPGIALRGILVSALAMIVAWIMQPLWDMLVPKRRVVEPAPAPAPTANKNREEIAQPADEEGRARRERRRWRKLLMFARPAANVLTGPGNGALILPDASRRRRDKARRIAELTYVMAMPDIAAHFPRAMFESWVNRYLGDHLSPEEVEENSLDLQMIIAKHQERQQGFGPGMNLEDLHLWYADEQKRIQSLDLDLPAKQAKLLHLQELFMSMSQRLLGDPPVVHVVPLRPRQEIALLEDKNLSDVLPQAKAE